MKWMPPQLIRLLADLRPRAGAIRPCGGLIDNAEKIAGAPGSWYRGQPEGKVTFRSHLTTDEFRRPVPCHPGRVGGVAVGDPKDAWRGSPPATIFGPCREADRPGPREPLVTTRADLAEACKLGYTGRSQSGNAVDRGGAGSPASAGSCMDSVGRGLFRWPALPSSTPP
jgi:hypothetical protein